MTDVSQVASQVDGSIRNRSRRSELWEFRALVAATYPLFLTATAVGRIMRAPTAGAQPDRRSVFVEAHTNAKAMLACSFMG